MLVRQALRLLDVGEPGVVVGVAVCHDDCGDLQWVLFRRLPVEKPRRCVSGKELVVATVDEHDLAGRRLEDQAVALLHIDHRHPEDPIGSKGRGTLDEADCGPVVVVDHMDLRPAW